MAGRLGRGRGTLDSPLDVLLDLGLVVELLESASTGTTTASPPAVTARSRCAATMGLLTNTPSRPTTLVKSASS